MKKQFVESLQEGDVVNDYFVAVRRDLRDTQSGGKFLGMVFKDRTGEIGAVLWNNAVSVAALFEVGDVVNVRGSISSYQGRLQVRVDRVLPLKANEYDEADLVHVPPGAGEALGQLCEILDTFEDPWLTRLTQAFRDDEDFMTRFGAAAAGKKWHHASRGGLARHCYEMARIAETVCELYPNMDRDMLLTGVFLHDVGKLDEMSHDLFVEYTTAGKLIGHLQIGTDMVGRKIAAIDGFPEHIRLQVLHLILSHHGEQRLGSPVVPKTLEAMALFHIDNLDAQADALTRIVGTTKQRNEKWSEYIALIDRQIWTKEP